MESYLGFKEVPEEQKSSYALKLVPWMNWDEWTFVKNSLFSNSTDSIASAQNKISAWQSRGCLPVVIEVTASIIQIQQMDPYYRVERNYYDDASFPETTLAYLYSMAIIRLVNNVVEKTRKKEEMSIAVAADAIGIPRMLVDVRHEASHRGLPSLPLARIASLKALDWLKSYYWEPQSKAIPFQGDGNAKVRKEIKSKLRELSFCLKSNQSCQSSSSVLKGKSAKHGELLCGRNKLLTLMACTSQKSKSGGSKKQITKILKSLVQLYSSFSSEVVNVLLEFLLKALCSSEHTENVSFGPTIHSILADWKAIIHGFWDKEPELLLNLLKTVLDMIETREAMKYEEVKQCLGISHSWAEFCQIDHLSSLFAWLVGILSKVPSTGENVPRRVFLELAHKCLLISAPRNKQLMNSALLLAKLMDDGFLMERVEKLSFLVLSNSDQADDESCFSMTSENISQMDESIHQAAKKLELLKQEIMKNKTPTSTECETENPQTWSLAKVWNPCPIGMLPRIVGSSGCLPTLNHIDDENNIHESDGKVAWELSKDGAKRDAILDLQLFDNSTVKKRKTGLVAELDHDVLLPMECENGCLLVDGVWKKVNQEELIDIESSVRILV